MTDFSAIEFLLGVIVGGIMGLVLAELMHYASDVEVKYHTRADDD
jgi:urea transporter